LHRIPLPLAGLSAETSIGRRWPDPGSRLCGCPCSPGRP
jgi:hypothetical protein